MNRPKIRLSLSIALLVVAVAVGGNYLVRHKDLLHQLAHFPVTTTALVLALDVIMLGVLILILSATIRIGGLKLGPKENFRLNVHSLFINFFIPGQGGPAYRGIYLYKRHSLKIRSYITATLLYYGLYGFVSVALLFSGRPWWQILAALAIMTAAGLIVIRLYTARTKLAKHELDLSGHNILYLLSTVIIQVIIQVIIYAVELHSVNHQIGFNQIVIYTGAANLALFVALTPGAIGIRESFLIFSQRLHHVNSANIVVANVIDRSVYLVFLLGLLVVIIALHLKGRLRLKNLPALLKQSFGQPD